MSYVVNNHLNNLYVLPNKAVGPGKNPKLINVEPTSIPEARVHGKNEAVEEYQLNCLLSLIPRLNLCKMTVKLSA